MIGCNQLGYLTLVRRLPFVYQTQKLLDWQTNVIVDTAILAVVFSTKPDLSRQEQSYLRTRFMRQIGPLLPDQ
jgi:hypothetical protein